MDPLNPSFLQDLMTWYSRDDARLRSAAIRSEFRLWRARGEPRVAEIRGALRSPIPAAPPNRSGGCQGPAGEAVSRKASVEKWCFTMLRDRLLRVLVVWGVVIWAFTEGLGSVGLLSRGPLVVVWTAVAGAAVWVGRSLRWQPKWERPGAVVWVSVAGVAAVLVITGLTAAFSPPNSSDAMAYHLPRVVYWAEQHSVRFFPTPYLNQIMLQPMAEYTMLQTYLLSGGDRFINFIQWLAFFGCIVAVSAIAREFGAGARGQGIAALFCATIPGAILAATGAKNDLVLALWLACAVYFAAQWARAETGVGEGASLHSGVSVDAALFGCALGLALLTKATAYLFAPWPVAAVLARSKRKRLLRGGLPAVLCALAINAPQYVRNVELSGSPLGFDSAQGNGYYRWRNETFGWKQTVSNFLRNTAEQLGARSEPWNHAVFDFVAGAHRRLNIGLNDPGTTWRGAAFAPPVNANHEANAPNRWQLAILCGAACWIVWRRRSLALYALSLLCAFVVFCAYLKWQPFMARLVLPLFVLGAPMASLAEEIRPAWVQVVLCIFLLNNARAPLLQNWVRPLTGPHSILHRSRNEMYFADMGQWDNAAAYPAAVRALRASGCGVVGIDINNFQLEYPLQALMRQAMPGVLFVHTGVDNVSRKYPQPAPAAPCAIACLDCLGDTARLGRYRNFPVQVPAGKFVILNR